MTSGDLDHGSHINSKAVSTDFHNDRMRRWRLERNRLHGRIVGLIGLHLTSSVECEQFLSSIPKPRLIAVDLDGTLLGADRQPVAESAQALLDAQASGVTVVLASGRMAPSIWAYAKEIGLTGPIIACNGGLALTSDGTEILHQPLSGSIRDRILAYGKKHNVHINAYSVDRTLSLGSGPWAEIYASRLTNVTPQPAEVTDVMTLLPTKMMLVDAAKQILRHRHALRDLEERRLASIVISEPEYLEFLGYGVDKGTALAAVAAWLGIDQSEVAAIGDYENDLQMLMWAGQSAAVGNAAPRVKEVADRVVSTNIEGGVAEFVRSIV
jgi:Cof subfamily protein (haloacid dehalogenase superfamily)